MAAFALDPLSIAFFSALNSQTCLDGDDRAPLLFGLPLFESFRSFKLSSELGWKPGIFDLRTRLGYTIRAEKDPLWAFSFNCSVRPGKWGRIGLKVASADFPEKWEYTLSWRFDKR